MRTFKNIVFWVCFFIFWSTSQLLISMYDKLPYEYNSALLMACGLALITDILILGCKSR